MCNLIGCFSSAQITLQSFGAKFAGGAVAATVRWNAVVASQRLGTDEVEYAQFVGQFPCLRLVPAHQRGMDDKLFVHSQVQRYIQGTDESVPAVRITAVICLGNAGDQIENTFASRQDGGKGEEKHVSSRNEGVRITAGRLYLIHGYAGIRQ